LDFPQKSNFATEPFTIHHAKAVEQWLAAHPRFTLLWLPTYCPRANPIERAFGDVHDLCTRNHMRKRLRDLVADVEAHLHLNGPGSTSCQRSTMSRPSPRRSRKSSLRNTQRLPRECTNLLWTDLGEAGPGSVGDVNSLPISVEFAQRAYQGVLLTAIYYNANMTPYETTERLSPRGFEIIHSGRQGG
jgi:hypothetical protein